jgi:predicted phosphodiesterase
MFDITLIGSISGQPTFSTDHIAALLEGERTPLRYGTNFVGRPATAIFRDGVLLAKLHTELDWAASIMEKWTHKTLEKERGLGVHHPDKTWFLALRREDNRLLIGNVCPLLKPLNQLLAEPPASSEESALRLSWFKHLFRMYFSLGREKGARLDEGLSNFGLDTQGALYYLDDDIYSWDDLISLPHVVGTWFRTYAWFDTAFCTQLGGILRETLSEDPQGTHYAMTTAEQLRGLYMPQSDRREALDAFGAALVGNSPATKAAEQRNLPSRMDQRYLALIGDIHANLPALEKVLGFLREQGITQGLVLGDIVGYGPHPCECIDRVAESNFIIIKGNHDHAAVTGVMAKGFSQLAKWAMEWTIPLLGEARKRWLEGLPLSIENGDWLALHGAPVDPGCLNGYVYLMTYEDNLGNLEQRGIRLCFHGHTHIPTVYARLPNSRSECITEAKQNLAAYRHALICPGSVGQPRNRQVGAQLAVWDRAEQTLDFVTLPYDVDITVGAMRDAGFPDSLSQRLLTGI